MSTDIRWKQRFQNYERSLVDFENSLKQTEYSVLERAGLIQLFEVSFELAWKTLKDILYYDGFDVKSPRAAIKQAFANNLITNGETWLALLEGRNIYAHTYDKIIAENSVVLIKEQYAPLLLALRDTLRGHLND